MKSSVLNFMGIVRCLTVCVMLAFSMHAHGQSTDWGLINGVFAYDNSVAIGTRTGSGVRLSISGQTAMWNLRLANPETGGVDWLVGSSSNLWDAGGGKFLISNTGSSATAAFAIDASGNVGIGISKDLPVGYKLAVAGKAVAEEVVVKLKANWPDYVFADNYKLPPLLEVERYIRENKHLPGVPSAETVAKQGLSLGEMNAVLLKKVEELTLYVIDLKKEVEALKAKK